MAALATPAEMIKRNDARKIGDLVGDAGVRVGHPELLTDANLQAAIDDAWGEVIAALMMSKRYTQTDLDALTGESRKYLIRINCMIAMAYLWDRRQWDESDDRERDLSRANRARKELEELRVGKKVLDIEGAKEAGLPEARQPSVASVRRTNLAVDEARRGYYLNRRFSTH